MDGLIPLDCGTGSRRWRWFALDGSDLGELLQKCRDNWFRFVIVDIEQHTPGDMLPLDVTWSRERRQWLIRCEHPSFAVVPDGEVTPYGGRVRLEIKLWPDGRALAEEIELQRAVIHDLREQLKG